MICIGELVRSEDNLAEPIFSFHICVGSGAQLVVIRLVWQLRDLLSHPTGRDDVLMDMCLRNGSLSQAHSHVCCLCSVCAENI